MGWIFGQMASILIAKTSARSVGISRCRQTPAIVKFDLKIPFWEKIDFFHFFKIINFA